MVQLSIEGIRESARFHHYNEIGFNETSRVISFINEDNTVRINVYYTTGTVASCLDHPQSGKTQLFRRNRTLDDVDAIFQNPRMHTDVGYHRKKRIKYDNDDQVNNNPASQQRFPPPGYVKMPPDECDDAKRWRYVHGVTGFCNDTQINQIAAFCQLWENVRFSQDGPSTRQLINALKEEGIDLSVPFCCESSCRKCDEHCGAGCNLLKILAEVVLETESEFYGVHKFSTGEDGEESEKRPMPITFESMLNCSCSGGIQFSKQYANKLSKLKRQLKGLPKHIRRELLVWYMGKAMPCGYSIFQLKEKEGEIEGVVCLEEYCQPGIRVCHFDYTGLVHPVPPQSYCSYHGF